MPIPSFEVSPQAKPDIIMLSRLASERQRQIITLWLQDLSVGEIARQLGISRAAVYEQLNRLGKKYHAS